MRLSANRFCLSYLALSLFRIYLIFSKRYICSNLSCQQEACSALFVVSIVCLHYSTAIHIYILRSHTIQYPGKPKEGRRKEGEKESRPPSSLATLDFISLVVIARTTHPLTQQCIVNLQLYSFKA